MVKKRYHAVSWQFMTTSKEEYGLGLRNLENMNTTCIMKLVWKSHDNEDELWCKVMKNKYQVTNRNSLSRKGWDSKLWRDIVKVDAQVQHLGNWCIGDGSKTNAWNRVI